MSERATSDGPPQQPASIPSRRITANRPTHGRVRACPAVEIGKVDRRKHIAAHPFALWQMPPNSCGALRMSPPIWSKRL